MSSSAYRYPSTPPVVSADGLEALADQFSDRVVLLAFWASWSRPSREDLARLAELQAAEPGGVRVIACSFDPPSHWTTRTLPILQGAKANYPCVVIPREAREPIRDRLDSHWSLDLPARFVLDGRGKIVARAYGATPIEAILETARRRAFELRPVARFAKASPARGARLRAKLVNIATGDWEMLPAATADPADPERLAGQVVAYVADRLDRSENQRIAILPFPRDNYRRKAGATGREIAHRLRDGLRRRGFFDLVGPVTTERMISRVGISAMAIDYDPAVARGRLAVDFLILGCVDGSSADTRGPSVVAAGTRSAGAGAE